MRSRPLIWTERSAGDLEEIEAYIAADDPIAAERWIIGVCRRTCWSGDRLFRSEGALRPPAQDLLREEVRGTLR